MGGLVRTVLTALVLASPAGAEAVHMGGGRYRVEGDRGGVISDRLLEITRLRGTARRVEITGTLCLSACTLYLGLSQTCVNGDTRFGFHGPTHFGSPLSPQDFDYWSAVVARQYPPRLRRWYLREGRARTEGWYEMTGAELAGFGVPLCRP